MLTNAPALQPEKAIRIDGLLDAASLELKMTLAERFDSWAQQHEQKGISKGEALLLQRQLVRRFGALPSDVVGQIAAANAAQLELWGDRVLDAASLEEVFRG